MKVFENPWGFLTKLQNIPLCFSIQGGQIINNLICVPNNMPLRLSSWSEETIQKAFEVLLSDLKLLEISRCKIQFIFDMIHAEKSIMLTQYCVCCVSICNENLHLFNLYAWKRLATRRLVLTRIVLFSPQKMQQMQLRQIAPVS